MKIWINRAGQNLGTFTEEEVQKGLTQGQFVGTDLGWQEGMETWKPLSEFAALRMPSPPIPDALRSSPLPGPGPVTQTAPSAAEGQEDGPAWEQRQRLGVVKALFETWKEVLLQPGTAFSRMRTTGGFTGPLLFTAIMAVIWAVFMLIYHFVFTGSFGAMAAASSRADSSTMAALGVGTSALTIILIFIIAVPLILAMNFVNAGITHFCLSLFKGTSKSYEATYRVVAYSYSAWIFSVIPCIGGIVAGIWALVCTIVGLSKVHRTEGWRAAAGVLLPVFVCVFLSAGAYLAILTAVFSSLHNANN
jgi:hypothetical protein